MPVILDNFIVLFSQKGAEGVRKTISEMEKEVSKSTKAVLKDLNNRKKERNSLLKDWEKAERLHQKEVERSGRAEARIFEFVEKNKQKEIKKSTDEIVKREKQRQKQLDELSKKEKEQAKSAENRRKSEIRYAELFDKIETAEKKEQDKKEREEAKAQRKAARDKLNAFKAWRKENGIEAKERRQEAGREWLEQKRLNKERGRARAIIIATAREEKKARAEQREQLKQEKERARVEKASLGARASNIRKIASFFGLSRVAMLGGALGAGILGAGMLAKGAWDFTKGKVHSRVKNALSYLGTGTEPKYAVGLDKELYGYGGEKGEAIQLLSQLSAGIGSMRYGDTSLVQTLGTFGISGIGAHSKSKDILRSVWQRAQGMDEEEREAMFNALGFSQGVKNFMRKGSLSEIDLDAAVSKWEEDDSEILKGMYDVENTIQKKVEEIASGVGKIAKWFEGFFNGDKKVAPNPEYNPHIPSSTRKFIFPSGATGLYPIPMAQSGDTINTTNNNSNITYYNYGGYFSDSGSDANINMELKA